jgi:hypothetical protein
MGSNTMPMGFRRVKRINPVLLMEFERWGASLGVDVAAAP